MFYRLRDTIYWARRDENPLYRIEILERDDGRFIARVSQADNIEYRVPRYEAIPRGTEQWAHANIWHHFDLPGREDVRESYGSAGECIAHVKRLITNHFSTDDQSSSGDKVE